MITVSAGETAYLIFVFDEFDAYSAVVATCLEEGTG
jgi:hypothetical protein